MIELQQILDKLSSYAPGADTDAIKRAYALSEKCHAGQVRKSGEPYLIHPLAVADILADLKLDNDCLSVGLLHDVIEDTLITYDELKLEFGQDIADMIDGLSKIAKISFKSKEEAQAENFRKMMFAMAKDVRVILVKLADRTHNMRTLNHMSPEKQQRIARETLDIYAPIANRLGIQKIKIELEDLSFYYLHKDVYDQLHEKLDQTTEQRNAYVEKVKKLLKDNLNAHEIPADVSGRVKHIYSIYKKMVRNNMEFEQIYDLIGFRMIVDNVGQCYQALGVVHAMYRPISERFKDYIAVPKSNGYQSLHTTVLGPGGEQIEIQIRTQQLHKIAETGIAAHWRYKEGKLAISKDDIERVAKLRQLYESARDLKDPVEFMESVRDDLFSDEIYVFTPMGAVKEFPEGATPLDFAFSVHTEVGLHCVGAKVNGRIVPLKYQLKNGETVEIITNPVAKATKDWLSVVVTSRAKTKIRNFLRQEERERGKELGKELLDREFKKYNLNLNRMIKDGDLKKSLEKFHFRTIDDLYISIAIGKIFSEKILADFVTIENTSTDKKSTPANIVGIIKEKLLPKKASSPVLIKGEGDILVSFAKCCSPLHGDNIVGVITVGHGITIHLAECLNALQMDQARRIDVAWDDTSKTPRTVRVKIVCVDRSGLLASMSKTISYEGVNIKSAECRALEDQKAINIFEISVIDRATLQQVIRALERIKGVISVERIST